MPFRFQAQDDIPYATVVILLTPDEWKRVREHDLPWPETLGPLESFESLDDEST